MMTGDDAGGDDAVDPRCEAARGELHAQVLADGDGVDDRVYWLYVPASYACAQPAPVLVDFHGTAGDVPEEAYQTPALIAFAEANGVIVARPRARPRTWNGYDLYQWDGNAGDIPRNREFAKRLVADLEARYAIDPARVYASGFSSGANMAAQFLFDAQSPFAGLAPIAGGNWTTQGPSPSLAGGPRLYLATGYRDYLWGYAASTDTAARAAGLEADRIWLRRTGGGHDLYAWHFDELWRFLDGGERPSPGAIAAPWTEATLPQPADVLAFARDGGDLVAAGGKGRMWRRGAGESAWTLELDRGAPDFTALCFGADTAAVGGQYRVAYRGQSGWTANSAFPDYGQIGGGWVNGAACRDDGSIVLGGYWSAAVTGDAGATYASYAIPVSGGAYQAQVAGLASAGATTIAVGYYDYVATGGATGTTYVDHGATTEWWNAVTIASGSAWAVGDAGAILRSSDGGATWTPQASGTSENLYAVHFADAQRGAAVGRRGTVVVTTNGGATWTPRPLGREVFLGAVAVDAGAVTVAGEDGVVASSPL